MNQMPNPDEMHRAPRPGPELCVEFFGLPGSGKTTIAREVHAILTRSTPGLILAPELLRDEAGVAVRVAAKLRLILSEFARNGALPDAVRKTFAIRQPRVRDTLRAVFTVATVVSLYANVGRRRISAVLDQGLLQALWSVQLRLPGNDSDALVADLLKEAAHSGRFHVSVETPSEVCAERLEARASKHSRMQDPGAAGDPHAWAKAELLHRTILSDFWAACRRQGSPQRVIVVDGTADPVEVAGQIVAAFLQFAAAPALPGATPNQGVTA